MIKRLAAAAVLICVAADSRAAVTVLKAGRLLDPHSGNVLSPAAVLIDGDRIKELGPPAQIQAHADATATVIDLGGGTLLPGLIDSHTHLLIDPIAPAEVERARHYNGGFFVMKNGEVVRNEFK